MKILGLDISSVSTGYCIISGGRLVKSTCGNIKTNSRKSYGERLNDFESQLIDVIKKYKPDEIIIEDIFKGRSMLTFKSLAMFRGVGINTIYRETGKNPISVMASEARSLVGIKNKKEDAFEFIVNKYNLDYDFEEHNDITDSITLALCAHIMKKQGIDEKSLRNSRRKKRRKRKRNKKGV
jgi:Holliday junction resolvasome RuvABC endonuclease subunit